jgi:hypothetical protein
LWAAFIWVPVMAIQNASTLPVGSIGVRRPQNPGDRRNGDYSQTFPSVFEVGNRRYGHTRFARQLRPRTAQELADRFDLRACDHFPTFRSFTPGPSPFSGVHSHCATPP